MYSMTGVLKGVLNRQVRIDVHIRDIFMKYSLDFHHVIGVKKICKFVIQKKLLDKHTWSNQGDTPPPQT